MYLIKISGFYVFMYFNVATYFNLHMCISLYFYWTILL